MGGYCAVLQKYLPWHLTLIHLNSACMSMPLYFVDCIVDTITHDSMSWLYFLNSGAGHISRSWCVVTGGLVPSAHSWSQGVQIPHEKYSSCAESWISRRLVLTDSQLASHVSQDKVQRDHKSELLGNLGIIVHPKNDATARFDCQLILLIIFGCLDEPTDASNLWG